MSLKKRGLILALVLGLIVGLAAIPVGLRAGKATAQGDPYILHEVAHPRAAILSNTSGAAENFAHGGHIGDAHAHNTPDTTQVHLHILQGETVRFKSGFGYEGVWFANAKGTITTSIEVYQRQGNDWVLYKADKKEDTVTGPKIVKGAVTVDVPFAQIGVSPIKNKLRTVAKPVDGPEAVDEDEVLVNVMVMDPAKVVSISGKVHLKWKELSLDRVNVVAIDPASGKVMGKAVTNADGRYSIIRLHAGKYIVRAAKEGSNLLPEFYDNAYFRAKATVLDLPEGTTVKNVDFTLEPGGRISGKVVSAAGQPVPGASVAFGLWRNQGWFYTRTKEDGAYLSPLLPDGEYVVRATARGFTSEFYSRVPNVDVASKVSVKADVTAPEVNIELSPLIE